MRAHIWHLSFGIWVTSLNIIFASSICLLPRPREECAGSVTMFWIPCAPAQLFFSRNIAMEVLVSGGIWSWWIMVFAMRYRYLELVVNGVPCCRHMLLAFLSACLGLDLLWPQFIRLWTRWRMLCFHYCGYSEFQVQISRGPRSVCYGG